MLRRHFLVSGTTVTLLVIIIFLVVLLHLECLCVQTGDVCILSVKQRVVTPQSFPW